MFTDGRQAHRYITRIFRPGDKNRIYSKDPIHYLSVGLFHLSTGNQR